MCGPLNKDAGTVASRTKQISFTCLIEVPFVLTDDEEYHCNSQKYLSKVIAIDTRLVVTLHLSINDSMFQHLIVQFPAHSEVL